MSGADSAARLHRLGLLAAGLAAAIGASALAGWSFGIARLIDWSGNGAVMFFWTAAVALLGGLVLLAANFLDGAARRRCCLGLAAGILGIAGIDLFELASGTDTGFNLAALHAPFQHAAEHPGRPPLQTVIGFLALAAALPLPALESTSRRRTLFHLFAAALLFAVGTTGLLAHLLRLDFLNSWQGNSRFPAAAALSFSLLAAGLVGAWQRTAGGSPGIATCAQRIRWTSLVLQAVTAMAAAMAAFATMQRQVETQAERTMQALVADTRADFADVIGERLEWAHLMSTRPALIQALLARPADPAYEEAGAILQSTAISLREYDFSAVRFLAGDVVVAESGQFVANPDLGIALPGADPAQLVWKGGYFLRSRLPMRHDGRIVGHLESEQPLPALDRFTADLNAWGKTGELNICASPGEQLLCFPSRNRPLPAALATMPGSRFAFAALAGAGQSGSEKLADYRGREVLAVYGPIGSTGLGAVMQVDIGELYEPVRIGFLLTLPVVALCLLAGAWIAQRSVKPLTEKLSLSLERASANEARFVAAAEANVEALFIFEAVRGDAGRIADFRCAYANRNAGLLFGRPPGELAGQALSAMLPEEARCRRLFDEFVRVIDKGSPLVFESPAWAPLDTSRWLGQQVARLQDGVLFTVRDMTEHKRAEEELSRLAHVDTLTGLPNRRMFLELLDRGCRRAARQGTGLAVLFFDLDGFKRINDTLGHAAGDRVLQEFARRVKAAVRGTDTVARLAGDEFTVLLEDLADPATVEAILAKIQAALAEPADIQGREIAISASAGMAYGSGGSAQPERLLAEADAEMYLSKRRRHAPPA